MSKCKIMHLGRNIHKYIYTMNGHQLTPTEEEKDVGVKVTSSLKPSAQCAAAAATAQSVLSQMGRSFHYRDRHIFVSLYKQYVRPHLEFATAAWSPWTEGDKAILEDVQKKAVRMVSGLSGTSYEEKLEEINLTSLEERRHQADMSQMFKIMHGVDRVTNLFVLAASGERTTRQAADALNVRVQPARLDIRKNFFTIRAASGWNKVPTAIKNARNIDSFKHLYREYRRTAPGAA